MLLLEVFLLNGFLTELCLFMYHLTIQLLDFLFTIQVTIQLTDHLAIEVLLAIQLPYLSNNLMPTVFDAIL